jgi:hypothetical protein
MEINLQEIDKANRPYGIEDSQDPGSNDLTEESLLVQRAQAGDRKAFSRLIRPYIRLSYHVALRITGNREDAEDASQQSLLKVCTRIHQFQGEAQFSTWLTRIAINEGAASELGCDHWLAPKRNPIR